MYLHVLFTKSVSQTTNQSIMSSECHCLDNKPRVVLKKNIAQQQRMLFHHSCRQLLIASIIYRPITVKLKPLAPCGWESVVTILNYQLLSTNLRNETLLFV